MFDAKTYSTLPTTAARDAYLVQEHEVHRAARRRELLAMTPAGQVVLDHERQHAPATPAPTGTAIFAAGTTPQHNTPQGQQTLQTLHDDAARAGAICNPPAGFASQHEATAVQQVHDLTVEHGATCASGDKPAWYSQAAAFAAGTTLKVVDGPHHDGRVSTLETRDETKAQRRRRLLSMTPLGRAVLAGEDKQA